MPEQTQAYADTSQIKSVILAAVSTAVKACNHNVRACQEHVSIGRQIGGHGAAYTHAAVATRTDSTPEEVRRACHWLSQNSHCHTVRTEAEPGGLPSVSLVHVAHIYSPQ